MGSCGPANGFVAEIEEGSDHLVTGGGNPCTRHELSMGRSVPVSFLDASS